MYVYVCVRTATKTIICLWLAGGCISCTNAHVDIPSKSVSYPMHSIIWPTRKFVFQIIYVHNYLVDTIVFRMHGIHINGVTTLSHLQQWCVDKQEGVGTRLPTSMYHSRLTVARPYLCRSPNQTKACIPFGYLFDQKVQYDEKTPEDFMVK